MKPTNVFLRAYRELVIPKFLAAALALGFIVTALQPSELESYPLLTAPSTELMAATNLTNDFLRFIPTLVQIGLPFLLGDEVGMVQLLYVGVTTTAATHLAKRVFNDWHVDGTRLGQRPSYPESKHNMPSGHSSMASCAVYFVGRRYSLRIALLLAVFLVLTMAARVLLNDHTISAVIAGTLLGFLTTALVTSRYQWRKEPPPLSSDTAHGTP